MLILPPPQMKRICGLEPILLRGVRLKLRVGAPAPRLLYLDALLNLMLYSL
jgi:hypothetical protein